MALCGTSRAASCECSTIQLIRTTAARCVGNGVGQGARGWAGKIVGYPNWVGKVSRDCACRWGGQLYNCCKAALLIGSSALVL